MAMRHQNRQYTPPHGSDLLTPHSAGSYRSAGRSTDRTTPSSVRTQITTPPRSPVSFLGREILPRVRKQDQMLDAVADVHHRRSEAFTSTGFPIGYDPRMVLPHDFGRSVSPADYSIMTPVSTESFMDDSHDWSRFTPPPNSLHIPHGISSHSHSISASSISNEPRPSFGPNVINKQVINRYAYPTYRQTPVYTSSAPSVPLTRSASTAAPANLAIPPRATTNNTASYPPPLSPELDFESYAEVPPAANLRNYLTEQNPSPSLVRRNPSPNRLHDMHFWWDVRNIVPWTDFKLETIEAIPGLSNLLELDIPQPALPTPARSNLHPETVASLHDIHAAYYVVKVNAALKASLGHGHLTMRRTTPPSQSHSNTATGPDFVARYAVEEDAGVHADDRPRGRVVGLVRSFEQWNSGMRTESATSKISYLRELAQLHRHMREHSCRYGFIITEIELVCVRMGRDPGVPVYGFLELATPVQLNASGRLNMTAPLALWYLHMLATNSPLPGQLGWKVDIGGAAALTRRNCKERDAWINLKPEGREKRDAKRNRGWVFPEEPLSRRECGRGKRWTAKMERERREREGINIAY